MERTRNNCAGMGGKLADLLLDPVETPAKVQTHVAGCADCSRELEELHSTMALLDTWESPEPTPYFLTRLHARLREERDAEPASWFERLRSRLVYGPAAHVRPLAAMALTIMLLVGGGTYLGITDWNQPAPVPGQTAVVHDLQTMDNNAPLLSQLEDLSANNDNGN